MPGSRRQLKAYTERTSQQSAQTHFVDTECKIALLGAGRSSLDDVIPPMGLRGPTGLRALSDKRGRTPVTGCHIESQKCVAAKAGSRDTWCEARIGDLQRRTWKRYSDTVQTPHAALMIFNPQRDVHTFWRKGRRLVYPGYVSSCAVCGIWLPLAEAMRLRVLLCSPFRPWDTHTYVGIEKNADAYPRAHWSTQLSARIAGSATPRGIVYFSSAAKGQESGTERE
ncbi:hypothetical protein DFH11DRAFT_1547922 [Phellopilus nigrolimitatus]|nr:hypothetical protein DFH11DRAFT_1547922 [Phellopilus nigrolimitatus]